MTATCSFSSADTKVSFGSETFGAASSRKTVCAAAHYAIKVIHRRMFSWILLDPRALKKNRFYHSPSRTSIAALCAEALGFVLGWTENSIQVPLISRLSKAAGSVPCLSLNNLLLSFGPRLLVCLPFTGADSLIQSSRFWFGVQFPCC